MLYPSYRDSCFIHNFQIRLSLIDQYFNISINKKITENFNFFLRVSFFPKDMSPLTHIFIGCGASLIFEWEVRWYCTVGKVAGDHGKRGQGNGFIFREGGGGVRMEGLFRWFPKVWGQLSQLLKILTLGPNVRTTA